MTEKTEEKIHRPKIDNLDLRDLRQDDLVVVFRREGRRYRVLAHIGMPPGRLTDIVTEAAKHAQRMADEAARTNDWREAHPDQEPTAYGAIPNLSEEEMAERVRQWRLHNCGSCARDMMSKARCALGVAADRAGRARHRWFVTHEADGGHLTTEDPCPGWIDPAAGADDDHAGYEET